MAFKIVNIPAWSRVLCRFVGHCAQTTGTGSFVKLGRDNTSSAATSKDNHVAVIDFDRIVRDMLVPPINDAFDGAMTKLSEMRTAFEDYETVTRWADSPVAKGPFWLRVYVDLRLASLRHHAVVHQLLHVVPLGFLSLFAIQLILRMPRQCWHINCCCNLLVPGTYLPFLKEYHAKQEPFVQSIQDGVLRQNRHSGASRTHRKPCIGRSIYRPSERTPGGRAHQSISRINA